MIVCVHEVYTDETPQVHFFDTNVLFRGSFKEKEFSNLLIQGEDISASYGEYGFQAGMPTVQLPCTVYQRLTLWC